MLMLFATLVARGHAPDQLRDTANGLLTHLALLFVPAGVGVMIHIERIRGEALPMRDRRQVRRAPSSAVGPGR